MRRKDRDPNKVQNDRHFWVFALMFLLQGFLEVMFWWLAYLSGPTDSNLSNDIHFVTALRIRPYALLITIVTLPVYIKIKRRDYVFWLYTLPAIAIHGYLVFQLVRSELFWFGLLWLSPLVLALAFVIALIVVLPTVIWSLFQDLCGK